MHLYVIQLFQDKKLLLINYQYDDDFTYLLEDLHNNEVTKNAVLRNDLLPSISSGTVSEVKTLGKSLAANLRSRGFDPITGGVLHNDYWQTYVIRLNSPSSNTVYVGESKYPREIRLKQHLNGIKSSRAFRKYSVIGIAYDLFDQDKKYYSAVESKAAERELAKRLKARGYTVYGGH